MSRLCFDILAPYETERYKTALSHRLTWIEVLVPYRGTRLVHDFGRDFTLQSPHYAFTSLKGEKQYWFN